MSGTGRRLKRRLSALEFESATDGMKMTTELKVAAYRYMVNHWTFREAADASGLNDRSIQRSVRRVWAAHTESPALPLDWVTELVSLPDEEMDCVKKHAKDLLCRAGRRR